MLYFLHRLSCMWVKSGVQQSLVELDIVRYLRKWNMPRASHALQPLSLLSFRFFPLRSCLASHAINRISTFEVASNSFVSSNDFDLMNYANQFHANNRFIAEQRRRLLIPTDNALICSGTLDQLIEQVHRNNHWVKTSSIFL